MKNQTRTLAMAAMFLAGTALADDTVIVNNNNDRSMRYDQDPHNLYHGNELSLDLFGTDTINQYTINHPSERHVRHSSRTGAGVGVNYFFTRYLGIGGEGYTENTAYHFVDDADGSLIFRIPIGNTGLAPYAFVGGGHKFDPVDLSYGHAGAGLDLRFTPHFGLFVDARYVLPDKTRNYGLGRAGLKFVF